MQEACNAARLASISKQGRFTAHLSTAVMTSNTASVLLLCAKPDRF